MGTTTTITTRGRRERGRRRGELSCHALWAARAYWIGRGGLYLYHVAVVACEMDAMQAAVSPGVCFSSSWLGCIVCSRCLQRHRKPGGCSGSESNGDNTTHTASCQPFTRMLRPRCASMHL